MKILFVWTGVTSYMADCWRELQRRPNVELKVVVERVDSGKEFDAEKVLAGLDGTVEDGWRPDVVFAVGWHSKVVRRFVTRKDWADVPKVCCFDMPWRWQLRCLAARFVLAPFLRHYAAAYVPGEACARYARWLGFKSVRKGLFAIDLKKFEKCERCEKCEKCERKGFLYVGRFSPEKRVDLVERAFRRYREKGGTWTIDYCGGPNFRRPEELPEIYASRACLVLASAFDPWPLVALEAKASGCAVIESDRCGNRLELRTKVVKYGDVEALADAMLDAERTGDGGRSADDLGFWGCAAWADRVLEMVGELEG